MAQGLWQSRLPAGYSQVCIPSFVVLHRLLHLMCEQIVVEQGCFYSSLDLLMLVLKTETWSQDDGFDSLYSLMRLISVHHSYRIRRFQKSLLNNDPIYLLYHKKQAYFIAYDTTMQVFFLPSFREREKERERNHCHTSPNLAKPGIQASISNLQ